MKDTFRYIGRLFLLLMGIFLLGKVVFIIYNHSIGDITLADFIVLWLRGLPLDVRTTAFLLMVPSLCDATMRRGLRYVMVPYFLLAGFVVASVVVADVVMYEFWEFKLSAVHLSYASSPEGTTNSVSAWFLTSRLMLLLGFALLVAVPAIRLTPHSREEEHSLSRSFLPLCLVVLLALMPVGVGSCYHRAPLFNNHAATNPLYRFVVSFADGKRFPDTYQNTTSATQFPLPSYETSTEVTDSLLRCSRPNVLLIMMESFGGKFVGELGGIPGVAPNLSRLIPTGIFWDRYYSNSFRTDRGTVSTYSGWVSYPTVSPMKETSMHPSLSSLSRSFQKAGYRTGYLYAGAMTNMGKYQYLASMGFEALLDDKFFTPEELDSSWGACDGTSAWKLYQMIAEVDTAASWFMGYQTISSHEPWDVPFQRLDDKRLNAFAYTDQCIGDLVDCLSALPVWDKLLVIIIPDHGFLYDQTFDDSEFFHSPMLWLGGAIKEPRRMHVLMNQSDIAATLLAQLGLPFNDYPWSRNVLSPDYRPFVYCNYPAGFVYKDETGETLYDLTAREPIPVGTPVDSIRLQKGLSILHASYQQLR